MSSAARSTVTPVTDPVRVMIVDDSVVVRGLLGRWIDEDPALAVVASHRNGRLAVEDVARANPDVVVLDLEMPEMDGMTALPLLLSAKPGIIVVVASTLSLRNAEASLRALALGAADYVPKPDSNSRVTTSIDFRRELIDKVKTLGRRAKGQPALPVRGVPALAAAAPRAVEEKPARLQVTRPYSLVRPRVLAIGSSTGGPQALNALFGRIGAAVDAIPVLVTQHMPPTFTTILADHLAKAAGRPSREARDGEPIRPGHIYVAPGGIHMTVMSVLGETRIRLLDTPPVNFCKPAVDPLFRSVAEAYGVATLAIVLTGMGSDGAEGVRAIAEAGGSVVAQDEATSVVWGMPGAAVATGGCSEILPLGEIGPAVVRLLGGGAS